MKASWMCSFFLALFLIFSTIAPQPSDYFPITNLSTTWTNDESSINSTSFKDGSKIRAILFTNDQDTLTFTCGFFCNGACTSYLFAILFGLLQFSESGALLTDHVEVIWSANRDYPVREGAILNLTAAGDLVLHDVDGSIVWTTNTAGNSTVGMNLTDNGNLVLFDGHNSTVWQSFDHPTDCLVRGQKLFPGQKLIATTQLPTNWTAQKDSFYLQVTEKGLIAYVESNPPQAYYRYLVEDKDGDLSVLVYIVVDDMSFYLKYLSISYDGTYLDVPVGALSLTFTPGYVKLMPDGHLKAVRGDRFGEETVDVLSDPDFGNCSYPLACGRNSICSANQQCSCPGKDSFKPVNGSQPDKGCLPVTPLRCNATQKHHFIEVRNIKYFTFSADMEDVDMETCKQACLKNCSCKAAIFESNGLNSSRGSCNLPSELFTMSVDPRERPINSAAFIKVQNVTSTPSSNSNSPTTFPKKKNQVVAVLGSTIGSVLLIVVVCFTMFVVRKKKRDSEIEEEYLDQVPGMPARFSYEQLKTATENFTKKLGEGGFGSVFEGTLEDGSRIAVKCLEGLVHVKKSFQAEVESIGSIHHVNLVRLRGFCAWNSERLLVYEFMSNGSLDQWIYNGDRKHLLGWECRRKIILDIAKGLAYLHEDCRQKIIHLDIKPQNILLDEEFNAKVSDFGLSKLIDRDQSQVITRMRGTPGYMAPECLGSVITEKVDVYSFGIVVLEMLCGRKNFDRSEPEEDWHLVSVFQRCWEEERLLDIVGEDMQVHGAEVIEMMKVASWCLQTDFTKRPSMSSVVKVLDGVMNVESDLDFNFWYSRLQKTTDEGHKSSKTVLPSILSGPR